MMTVTTLPPPLRRMRDCALRRLFFADLGECTPRDIIEAAATTSVTGDGSTMTAEEGLRDHEGAKITHHGAAIMLGNDPVAADILWSAMGLSSRESMSRLSAEAFLADGGNPLAVDAYMWNNHRQNDEEEKEDDVEYSVQFEHIPEARRHLDGGNDGADYGGIVRTTMNEPIESPAMTSLMIGNTRPGWRNGTIHKKHETTINERIIKYVTLHGDGKTHTLVETDKTQNDVVHLETKVDMGGVEETCFAHKELCRQGVLIFCSPFDGYVDVIFWHLIRLTISSFCVFQLFFRAN